MFASHLTEHYNFVEIIWKVVVRSFLGIVPIVVSSGCTNVTYRSSSRAVAEMSRTDRHLVQLQE